MPRNVACGGLHLVLTHLQLNAAEQTLACIEVLCAYEGLAFYMRVVIFYTY